MEFYAGIGALFICLICLLDLPWARKMNQSLYGFFLMNGRLRLGGFVASIMSANLSLGNFLIFIASWGYAFGWGGIFWFTVNLCLNVVAYVVFIPAFRRYIEDRENSGTIHEYLSETFAGNVKYSRRIRIVASAATVLGLLFAIVFELHLATEIFSPLIGIDKVYVFLMLCGFICIYSAAGGFHTLIFTDILHSIVMISGTLAVVWALKQLAHVPAATTLSAVYPVNLGALNIGWPSILGISVIGSGWFLVAMDQWQRSCATRDSKRTKGGMIVYLVLITIFGIVYGLLGMYDKAAILPSVPPSVAEEHVKAANPLIDFFLAEKFAILPTWAFAVVGVALLCAAMSTANTFLVVSGHSLISDILVAQKKGTSITTLSQDAGRLFLGLAQASIIGMGVFILLTWLLFEKLELMKDPLSFFFIAYSIQFALLAPMVLSRFPKSTFPSPRAIYHGISAAIFGAVVGGISLWKVTNLGAGPFLGVAMADWLSLMPVITMLIGFLAIALSSIVLRR